MKTNVFANDDALKRLLSPDNVAPLIQLPEDLNPFYADGVEIWAKVYGGNQHIKLVTAIGMLESAQKLGKLNGVTTLVEASSGNMVHALHIVKDWFGIKEVIPVIPRDIAPGKLEVIRLLGMDPVFFKDNGVALAEELGKRPHHLNLNQYHNSANPTAHEKHTGPQIFDQTEGRVRIFAAGLGTTGTMEGVCRFLRAQLGTKITTVGIVCKEGNPIPGIRSFKKLKEIGFSWKVWSDHLVEMTTPEAYLASLNMQKKGISAGPSSGAALQGLIDFLRKEKSSGKLDSYRNSDGKIVTVFVCPDAWEKYIEKYTMALDSFQI